MKQINLLKINIKYQHQPDHEWNKVKWQLISVSLLLSIKVSVKRFWLINAQLSYFLVWWESVLMTNMLLCPSVGHFLSPLCSFSLHTDCFLPPPTNTKIYEKRNHKLKYNERLGFWRRLKEVITNNDATVGLLCQLWDAMATLSDRKFIFSGL